jgi:transposase
LYIFVYHGVLWRGDIMKTKYSIVLSAEERAWLEGISHRGKNSALKIMQARALLLCDTGEHGVGWSVQEISEALGISCGTIDTLKKRVVLEGLEKAFERKQRETPPREVIYDGAFDAHVVALACSEPPKGYQRWTVRLLAKRIVELEIVPAASHMSVHRALKKTNCSLTAKSIGKFPQKRMQPL